MSIQSEILRIKNNVDAAYDAVEALGGTLPQDQTVANLLAAIASIKGISTIQPSIYQGDISKQIARIAADIASAYRLCEDSGATMPASLVVGNLATCISTIPTGSGWSWGSEDGEATEVWFAGLAEYLSYNPPDWSWVGKEKSVTLSSEVLGTTTHKIRCIGIEQDGERTVTFQTSDCLNQGDSFSDYGKYNLWYESRARERCISYYNAFPGKAYIKTVSKGTCRDYSQDRAATAIYGDETVWLPSEREMGLDSNAPISVANSTTTNAECTYGFNEKYNYYINDNARIKKIGDSAGVYMLRSRYYYYETEGYSQNGCAVAASGKATTHLTGNVIAYGYAPAFVIGPSTTFNWGDEDAEADEAWFARLYGFLRYNPGDSSWVGKTKSVTLSSPVLGTTTHKIVCIGVNQDADNTATFQTLDCLATTSTFSSLSSDSSNYANGSNYHHSANLIYDGNASGACKAYYDAFPGKSYIKQLNKGTCVTQVPGRNGTATYQNQYVWIPSEGEVGLDQYASLGYPNWTTTNGECTYGKKFQYSYYTGKSKRIKKRGDSGSALQWWTRGHYCYNYADYVCYVSSDGVAGGYGYYYGAGVAPAFCIGGTSFNWGDEDAEADATWFANLKTYLVNNPGESSWVGKEKVVTLTSEVLGTTTHKIRCIGVNQDADNTVTFQTSNCLATKSTFSSLSNDSSNYARGSNYHDSANLIYDGNASGVCKLYYDAFPGKASIKQLNKGTCITKVSEHNGTATYQNQYVWIPSEGEVGLDSGASLSYSNWTTTNGECTYGKKFQYSYYSEKERRVKKIGDSGSAYIWWTRGHYYYSVEAACRVNSNGSANGQYYWANFGVAPAFCIGPTTFEWGDEDAEADEQWFADLADYLAKNPGKDEWVGKEKVVTLTSAVLNTTTHKIRCIGVNQDGDRTVTFQTSNCLVNTAVFGDSAVWIGSTARAECQNYYNAFPGKTYIKTVSKGTCPSTNNSRNGTPTYNNETVWLPSEREMGFDSSAPISTANSTTSKAECTYGYNAAYSYYNSSDRRKKTQGDSGSAVGYWERSRYYHSNRSDYADSIGTEGYPGYTGCNHYALGVAPAFVIGN